jgi:hypothetical protein
MGDYRTFALLSRKVVGYVVHVQLCAGGFTFTFLFMIVLDWVFVIEVLLANKLKAREEIIQSNPISCNILILSLVITVLRPALKSL